MKYIDKTLYQNIRLLVFDVSTYDMGGVIPLHNFIFLPDINYILIITLLSNQWYVIQLHWPIHGFPLIFDSLIS